MISSVAEVYSHASVFAQYGYLFQSYRTASGLTLLFETTLKKSFSQIVSKFGGCSVYFSVSDKISPVPDLYCVEFQRRPRDLGVSIVLQATSDLAARGAALRLFPEYKAKPLLMRVSAVRYVELDWDAGRTLVITKRKRREIPAAVAEISRSLMKERPHPDEEEHAE